MGKAIYGVHAGPDPRTAAELATLRARVRQLEAELAELAARLPLDRLVGKHGSRLSGGEAQRVALARLLLREDAVVILDEPTEHLDPDGGRPGGGPAGRHGRGRGARHHPRPGAGGSLRPGGHARAGPGAGRLNVVEPTPGKRWRTTRRRP